MNIVNENIVSKILEKSHDVDTIAQLKWHVQSNIIKAGNNYMSEVYRLTIEYLKNGQPHKQVLFVKVPANSPMYETASKWSIFIKEMTMYTDILPQIYTFEEQYFTAQLYYADEKQSLFLKDLAQSGYKTGSRTQQLDFEHSAYALKCLAKLHGLSVHLEKTKGLPEVIRKDPFYNDDNQDMEMKNQFLEGLKKFYDHLDPAIRVKYAERIEFFKNINFTQMVENLNPECSSFNVLNHGDYWTNNIMFKYDKYGIIKNAKMLDFQMCRWSNPAIDLIYFTITSVRYDVYVKHFDLLISIYLDTLNKILANFDHGTYEIANLKADIENRYVYSIVVLACILPIIVSDPDDPINMNEIIKDNEFDATVVHKTYKHKQYKEIATNWFLHFAEKDIPKFENKESEISNGNVPQRVNGICEEIL